MGSSISSIPKFTNAQAEVNSIEMDEKDQEQQHPCGLVNLGNTCYLNSVLQVLYLFDELKTLYLFVFESIVFEFLHLRTGNQLDKFSAVEKDLINAYSNSVKDMQTNATFIPIAILAVHCMHLCCVLSV